MTRDNGEASVTMKTREILCVLLAGMTALARAEMVGIARIPDPPPAVDGTLGRLNSSPSTLAWSARKRVVFGVEKWTGPNDLSGELYLGWDENCLYVGARVVDDTVVQPYFGSDVYKGDHLEVFLDVPRRDPGLRSGRHVAQIGLSPGDFGTGAAAVLPEVVQWSPNLGSIPGARIAARRNADGYQLEAALPWNALGVAKPETGLCLGLDVTLSDADERLDSGQETMASLLSDAWALRDPNRMLEAALAGTDGVVDPATLRTASIAVTEGLRVASGQALPVDLRVTDGKPVKELIVRARIEHEKLAGGTQALRLELNGTELDLDRVRNRLPKLELGTHLLPCFTRIGWFVLYSPDYRPPPAGSTYAVRGVDPCEFRFDVTDLWQPAGNRLVATHTQPKVTRPLVLAIAVSETLSPKREPPRREPAPTGPIPTFEPAAPARPGYFAWRVLPDGSIEVTVEGVTWTVESEFSTIAPGWVRLGTGGAMVTTPEYRVERQVEPGVDHLLVTDRITNTSGEDQPVMLRHSVDAGESLKTVTIAGNPIAMPRYRTDEGAHPAAVALCERAGIGLLSEDDIMRAQATLFRDGSRIGIHNDRFVVAKGGSVTLQFAIYPLEIPDGYLFINRVRQNWGTNFTVDGSFAFMKQRPPVTAMDDGQFLQHLTGKSARYICSSMPYRKGVWAHGTAFKHTDSSLENELFSRARRLQPDTRTFFYFHCYISVHEDDKTAFADAILRRPDGTQADYRDPKYPLFVPRPGSSFAAAQDELLDLRYQRLDLDGIYWDEIEYSAYEYDYSDQWDGVSALIDPTTHRIVRKVANVTLATQPWRLATARRLLDRGRLIGNGAPRTRTFSQLHFPRFIETASITNLTRGQLYTPIALGDHLTERTPVDCYRNMLDALNFGAVYYWYGDQIVATEPTLTSVMFPVTWIALGPGYLIAKERILTNRSGLFGWGDASQFEAVVFDENGRRTDSVSVSRVEKDGKAYGEVRIPQGYGVALIRR